MRHYYENQIRYYVYNIHNIHNIHNVKVSYLTAQQGDTSENLVFLIIDVNFFCET